MEATISSPLPHPFRRFLGVVRWLLFALAVAFLISGLALLTQDAMPSPLVSPARAFKLSFGFGFVANFVQMAYEARGETEFVPWFLRFCLRALLLVIPVLLTTLAGGDCC